MGQERKAEGGSRAPRARKLVDRLREALGALAPFPQPVLRPIPVRGDGVRKRFR